MNMAMNGLILYIIKCTLYTSLFQSFYLLVMRKTTFFRLNRIAFIAGTFLCLVLPFINIQMPAGQGVTTPIEVIEGVLSSEPQTLPAAVIGSEPQTNWIRLITNMILMGGAIVSFIVTMVSYVRMSKLIRSVKPIDIDGTSVKILDDEIPSFSWGRHIVISRKDLDENPAILTHEMMHVKCGHSFDLIAYTAVTVLQWFNPIVWIARTELKMLHEYEADELTINKGIDATQYQLLLVKKAVGVKRFQLANGFNHSKLKNRITMMHKNKTNKWMRLAYILCVPALIGAMCCCSGNKTEEEDEAIPFELLFKGFTVHLTSDNDLLDATIKDFTISQLEGLINSARISSEVALQIEYDPTVDDRMVETLKEAIQEISGERNIRTERIAATGIPFQLVEDKPTFQGGDANQFSRWVNTNLRYPEEAKDKNLQGRVTLSFTVDKTGKVTDVHVLRGVDPILDKEAMRVVGLSPDWEPGKVDGKAVPVTYTFPVIFKLQ